MFFPKLQLTDSGRALIVKALAGETLTFTRLAIGAGDAPRDAGSMTELADEVIGVGITGIEKGDGVATLEGSFDNSRIGAGFYAKELGVFADDPDDGEILYAYSNSNDYPAYIPTGSSTSFERVTLRVLVAVGDAETVEAKIGEFGGYATTEELEAHENDTGNPHETTAEQVGLGNVPNVTTDNQTPTFPALTPEQANDPSTIPLQNITSGETLSVMFGKIRNFITRMLHHLTQDNPHGITAELLGASRVSRGSYTGTGRSGVGTTNRIDFTLNMLPKLLIVQPKNAVSAKSDGFMAIHGTSLLTIRDKSQDDPNLVGTVSISWGDKYISWYAQNAACQQNERGQTYYYILVF